MIDLRYSDMCVKPQSLQIRFSNRCPIVSYLKRWWNAFSDDESSLGCTLGVILSHQIIGEPDAVGLFRRAFCQRSASVPRQRRQADAMIELCFAIANGHRLEEFGLGSLRDCHHVGNKRFVR
jgi:hypothetical protein